MQSSPPALKKLLVTGFGQFPGVPFNLSETLVRTWQSQPPAWPGVLRCEPLPTAYGEAGGRIAALLGEFQPDAVLMFGVAGTPHTLRLERVALNIDDATIADTTGDLRQGGAIAPGAPLALATPLDLQALCARLIATGIDAEVSNHAGTYVCNHGYYAALAAAARLPRPCTVLFTHIPDASKLDTESQREALRARVVQGADALIDLLSALLP